MSKNNTPLDNKCPKCKCELNWILEIKEGDRSYRSVCECGEKKRKTWRPHSKKRKGSRIRVKGKDFLE